MNNSSNASRPAIWAGLLAIYIIWGSTYLAIRFVVESMPPFLAAGLRFLIAGTVLYVFSRLRGDRAPRRIEWRSAGVIGLFLLVGGNGGVMWAEQRVASGIAALMIASEPLWISLLDTLRPGGKRPNGWVIAGILVGFSGILVLMGPAQLLGLPGEIEILGVFILLLASLSWAVGSLYTRGAALPDSPLLSTGMEMLLGSLGLLVLGTVTGEWSRLDLSSVSSQSWMGFAYLVVFGSWVAFASYTWLLRVAPTMLVSTYAYVNPLVAIMLGSIFVQEPLTPRIILAALLILGSVVVITLKQPAFLKSPAMQDSPPVIGND